jgi:hypothetical protein
MRIIALDAHGSFAQMAVLENGTLRDAGKVDLERSRLLHFAKSLRGQRKICSQLYAKLERIRNSHSRHPGDLIVWRRGAHGR